MFPSSRHPLQGRYDRVLPPSLPPPGSDSVSDETPLWRHSVRVPERRLRTDGAKISFAANRRENEGVPRIRGEFRQLATLLQTPVSHARAVHSQFQTPKPPPLASRQRDRNPPDLWHRAIWPVSSSTRRIALAHGATTSDPPTEISPKSGSNSRGALFWRE